MTGAAMTATDIPRTVDARHVVAVVGLLALAALAGCSGSALGSPDTAIQFENATAEAGVSYQTDGGGAGNGNDGVFVADVNDDGWQDFLAIGGERPVLYENQGGAFERSDALPALSEPFKSALFVDYDGDGWQDLLLLRPGDEPVTLHNDEGQFRRVDVGLGELTHPLGATAADYDRDGDADLFVYQSGNWSNGKPAGYFSRSGYVADDNGHPNVLYENVGGEFRRVTDAGIEGTRWSLAASFVDLNGDRYPEIHIANDYNNDTVYVNRGDGTFEQRLLPGSTARNGMSSEIGDVNGDGHQDVFTTNIELPMRAEMDAERFERLQRLFSFVIQSGRTQGNTLMLNDGTGNLSDAAPEYDVRVGGWGWASSHTDFDNDGDGDIVHATQHVVRIDRAEPHYTYPMVFERTGENFTNRDASDLGFDESDGRGLATLDYDRDGDRDVLINSYDGQVRVYENVGADANSLQFRAVDENDTTAYGATVTISVGDHETVVQQTIRSDFLSQESRVNHVGLGTADAVDVHVVWPDGTERTFEGVAVDQRIRVTRDGIETVTEWE